MEKITPEQQEDLTIHFGKFRALGGPSTMSTGFFIGNAESPRAYFKLFHPYNMEHWLVVENYTDPDLRRKGIQTHMRAKLVEYMRSKNITKVEGEIFIGNLPSFAGAFSMKNEQGEYYDTDISKGSLQNIDEVMAKGERVKSYFVSVVTDISKAMTAEERSYRLQRLRHFLENHIIPDEHTERLKQSYIEA